MTIKINGFEVLPGAEWQCTNQNMTATICGVHPTPNSVTRPVAGWIKIKNGGILEVHWTAEGWVCSESSWGNLLRPVEAALG